MLRLYEVSQLPGRKISVAQSNTLLREAMQFVGEQAVARGTDTCSAVIAEYSEKIESSPEIKV